MTTLLTFQKHGTILYLITMNTGKYSNLANVLHSPSNIVPALSDNEIFLIIVESIHAYVEGDIDFETLVDVTTKIMLFRGIREEVNDEINKALSKTISLSKYLSNHQNKKETINGTLVDVLDGLSDK